MLIFNDLMQKRSVKNVRFAETAISTKIENAKRYRKLRCHISAQFRGKVFHIHTQTALLKALDVVNKNSDQFRAFFAKQRCEVLSVDNRFRLNTRFFCATIDQILNKKIPNKNWEFN